MFQKNKQTYIHPKFCSWIQNNGFQFLQRNVFLLQRNVLFIATQCLFLHCKNPRPPYTRPPMCKFLT